VKAIFVAKNRDILWFCQGRLLDSDVAEVFEDLLF